MKKKAFLLNSIILTAGAILMRSAGMGYRVYVSNLIGAEGMGLYQLIFSVYTLFITIATSGISVAVTRLVTENEALGYDYRPVLKKSVAFSLTLSLLSAGLLFFFSDFAGTYLLHDARTAPSLRVLALGLPFLAVSACFRGYFYAVRKGVKSAGLQMFEMLVEIAFALFVLQFVAKEGLTYTCLALVIASTAAEVASCLMAYLLYRLDKNKPRRGVKPTGILRSIFKISLPIAASSYIRSIFSTAENILIPVNLEKSGLSKQAALSQLGIVRGMALPLLLYPSLLLNAFSTLLIPEITESDALHHTRHVAYAVGRVFRMTMYFAMLVCAVFFFFSNQLAIRVYQNSEVGIFLKILAPLVPLMYLDDLADGMLKGMNQQVSLLKINIADSVIRMAMVCFLIPVFGLPGMVAALIVSNIFNPALSIRRLLKVAHVPFLLADWVIKPLLAASVACLSSILLFHVIPLPYSVTLMIAVAVLFYLVLLRLFRCVGREDARWLSSFFRNGGA